MPGFRSPRTTTVSSWATGRQNPLRGRTNTLFWNTILLFVRSGRTTVSGSAQCRTTLPSFALPRAHAKNNAIR